MEFQLQRGPVDWWLAGDYRITSTEVAVNRHCGWTRVRTAEGRTVRKKRYRTERETRYYGCVRTRDGWRFVKHHRPYRSYAEAERACRWHARIWARIEALARARGNRQRRLEAIVARARGRTSESLQEIVCDNAFWRRRSKPTGSFDAVLAMPAGVTLEDSLAKLLAKSRTKVLADEQRAMLSRGASPRKASRRASKKRQAAAAA